MQTIQILGVLLRTIGFCLFYSFFQSKLLDLFCGHSVISLSAVINLPNGSLYFLGSQGFAMFLGFILMPFLYIHFLKKDLLPKIKNATSLVNIMIILGMAVLLYVFYTPLNGWLIDLNKSMHLPDAFRELEQSMILLEQTATQILESIALIDSFPDALLTITVITIIPAIGEEFVFRGVMMNEFRQQNMSHHNAIWATAFIFSFIHFQFFGFFPRLILGAMLGYMYYWTGTLLAPIIFHFINNALTLLIVNLHQHGIISVDPDQENIFPWYIVIVSLLLSMGILYYFRKWGLSIRKEETIPTDQNKAV